MAVGTVGSGVMRVSVGAGVVGIGVGVTIFKVILTFCGLLLASAALTVTCPLYIPSVRLPISTKTLTSSLSVPIKVSTLNQLLFSLTVQLSVPLLPLLIANFWLTGLLPPCVALKVRLVGLSCNRGMGVGVAMLVGVMVGIFVGVRVGVLVGVSVGVSVGVRVTVGVSVAVEPGATRFKVTLTPCELLSASTVISPL